jgi:hypothetical protein
VDGPGDIIARLESTRVDTGMLGPLSRHVHNYGLRSLVMGREELLGEGTDLA